MAMRKRTLSRGWYPVSADQCNREIEEFLRGFTPPAGMWIAAVVPHAGWFFSGKAAARAIGTLATSSKPDRIVIFGGHLGGGQESIVYPEDWWENPLGPHPMDSRLAAELVAEGHAIPATSRFQDNTVEIQIPLIRKFFPDTPLLALHPPASLEAVRTAETVWELLKSKGLKALYIGSADLTHYGPNYGFFPHGIGEQAVRWVKEENDASLIKRAITMDTEAVLSEARQKHNTCSAGAIVSVIAVAARHGVREGRLLEYYTSYDVMGDNSFVGYAAIVY